MNKNVEYVSVYETLGAKIDEQEAEIARLVSRTLTAEAKLGIALMEIAKGAESHDFWKTGWYALDKDNQDLRAGLARERELNQGLRKEMSALQDELFEMCKLVHKYQNELWTDAKIAADSLLEDKSKPVVTNTEEEQV